MVTVLLCVPMTSSLCLLLDVGEIWCLFLTPSSRIGPPLFGTVFNFASLEASRVNTATLGVRASVYKWGGSHKHSVRNKSPAQVNTTRKCPNRNSNLLALKPLLSNGRHHFHDVWGHSLAYREGKDYDVGGDNEEVVWTQRNPKNRIS